MRAALLALVLLLALPASAHAGRAERHDYREFGVRGEPTVATGEVRYAATEGAGTRITVRQVGGAVEIVDTGGAEAGPGCRSDAPDRVTCPDSTRAILDAGDGDDVVDGVGLAAFAVQAREGDDRVTGATLLDGGPGDDVLRAGSRGAQLTGGPGADELIGGAGSDRVTYDESEVGVHADLEGDADDGAPGEGDRIDAAVDNLTGGRGPDELIGNARRNYFFDGGDARDTIVMGGGDDSLFSDGPDRVDLGAGKDYAFFYGPATLDRAMLIEGGPGADTLHGSSGSERMRGGGGDDLIEGRGGDDDFDVRGGGQDDVVCDPDAARPRGTVRLDVRDGVSGCGTILRTGTARPLFVVADRDVVTLECPPDQRRGCRGTIRVESGGRTVQRRRFAMRPDRLTDVIVRRRPLPRGRYRLTITTRNAIGRPVVIRRRFTVAARRP